MKSRIGLYYCEESASYKLKFLEPSKSESEEFFWTLHHSKLPIAQEIEKSMNEASKFIAA